MSDALLVLQEQIDYHFVDVSLLERVLTHKSAHPTQNNSKLEFLGDAILDAIISHYLFVRTSLSSGDMTNVRAHIVCGESLAQLPVAQLLVQHIRVHNAHSGLDSQKSTAEDAFEALVAAVYLDAGLASTTEHVLRWLESRIATVLTSSSFDLKGAKNRLQEIVQQQSATLPHYEKQLAAGHTNRFVAICVYGQHRTCAEGNTKKQAEQQAAEKMIALLAQHQPAF